MTSPLLDLPASLCAQSVVMTLQRVVGMSESPFTLEQQFFKWPGERWNIEAVWPPALDEDVADEWIAFLMKLQGTYGRFLMGDPSRPLPRGVGGGSPLVNGLNQTGNTLVVKNAPLSTTNWLKRGDNFQLGTAGDSRLYKLTAPASTNGSGATTLNFEPALRTSPADSAAITINNPRSVFRLESNDAAWGIQPGLIYTFGFKAIEVL